MMKLIKTIIVPVFLLLMMPAISHSENIVFAVKSSGIEPYNLAIRGVWDVFKDATKPGEVRIEVYDLIGDESRWKEVLKKVKEERPSLIMTFGTFATELARKDIKDIPIVFSTVLNPEESGIVTSLTAHSNDLTGASLDIPFETQFSYILSVAPSATRIGVLYNPKETSVVVGKARTAAAMMGLTLVTEPVRDETELPKAIDRLMGRIDVLWSVADSTVFSPPTVQQIIVEAIKHKIPFMGLSKSFVKAGALFSIKWDDTDIGRQAGEAAIKVLSRSEDVSNIPVSTPRNLSILINQQTAKAIGLIIPTKTLRKAEAIN